MLFPYSKNIALRDAICFDRKEEARKLVLDGADPLAKSAGCGVLLEYALKKGRYEIVGHFIDHCLDPVKNRTQLMKIIDHALADKAVYAPILIIKSLDRLSSEALTNVGGPAAQYAVDCNSQELMQGLLDRKVDITAPFNDITPLSWSITLGRNKMTGFLLSNGADIGKESVGTRNNAVHMACQARDYKLIKALLDKGLDINAPNSDESKETPLHCAIMERDLRLTEFLLGNGADPLIKDARGFTPMDLAFEINNPALLAVFREGAMGRKAAPVAESAEHAVDGQGWLKLSADRIALITIDPVLNRKTTDEFNFAARERSLTHENLQTGAQSSVLKFFDEMPDKTVLKNALNALRDRGGTADEASLYPRRTTERLLRPT